MKTLFFSFLALFLLSSCGGKENSHSSFGELPQVSPQANVSVAKGKAFFSFTPEEKVILKGKEKKTITLSLSPTYEPVSSVEVSLRFHPDILKISQITPLERTLLFSQEIDEEKGILNIIAALPGGEFDSEIHLFSFDVQKKDPSFQGEASVEFLPQKTKALVSDAENTNTAVTEDMPSLVFSLL